MLAAAGDEDDDEGEDAAHFGVHRWVRVRGQCFGALPLLETVLDAPPHGVLFKPLHCGPEEGRKSPHTLFDDDAERGVDPGSCAIVLISWDYHALAIER